MSYTKILLLQASAQLAYKSKKINDLQYSKILDDLSIYINEVDVKKVNNYFKDLINN